MKPVFAWLCKDYYGDDDSSVVHLLPYEPESYMYKTITPIVYFEVEVQK